MMGGWKAMQIKSSTIQSTILQLVRVFLRSKSLQWYTDQNQNQNESKLKNSESN